MNAPAKCDRCGRGTAISTIKRILLMIDGKAICGKNFCTHCLNIVTDILGETNAA